MEDDLFAVGEKLDKTSVTGVSLQPDKKKEEDCTASWVDSIKDLFSAVLATQPENPVTIEHTWLSTMGLPSNPELHGNSVHGFNTGHVASNDPGLHTSNHLASRQSYPRSNLSSHTNDASVKVPLCLAPHVGVNYQPPSASPQADFLPNYGSIFGNTNMQGLINQFPSMHTIQQTVGPSVP